MQDLPTKEPWFERAWVQESELPHDGSRGAFDGDRNATRVATAGSVTPKVLFKKDCVFIHGVGQTPVQGTAKILNGSYPGYWGAVEKVTTQCASWIFMNVDTVYRGWDNASLQQDVCNTLTYDIKTGKSMRGAVKHRIIFSHSMGNMILAGAIENKLCSIDNSTSTWYEVSGPMYGSVMATKLKQICKNPGLYNYVASFLGFCVSGLPTPAYNSLIPSYPGLERLAETIAPRLSGALCGTSAYGLNSIYSAEMEATAALAGFLGLNDGVVPWSSCSVKGSTQMMPDYHESWYAASINHIDAECYNGDGWWGDDRQPCSWYSLRR